MLYIDAELLVLDKPAGLPVQGGPGVVVVSDQVALAQHSLRSRRYRKISARHEMIPMDTHRNCCLGVACRHDREPGQGDGQSAALRPPRAAQVGTRPIGHRLPTRLLLEHGLNTQGDVLSAQQL